MSTQYLSAPRPSTTPSLPAIVVGEGFFDELEETYQSISRRAYALFEGRGRQDGHDLDDWLQAEADILIPVRAGIEDSRHQLTVRALVPSFDGDEIKIKLEPRRLIIHGSAKRSGGREIGEQGGVGQIPNRVAHAVDLPDEVDPESVSATLKEGALEITLRKVMTH